MLTRLHTTTCPLLFYCTFRTSTLKTLKKLLKCKVGSEWKSEMERDL